MIALSPAKINIGLSVISTRDDGYHNLESVIIPVPLYDIIEIDLQSGSGYQMEFASTGIDTGASRSENLCVKSAEMFLSEYGHAQVRMHLHKQIPAGAGLGGGSSDATTVLHMLNKLTGSRISKKELHAMAASIGSDCPFFLYNEPMLMTGRGDILEPVSPDIYGLFLVLLFPEFKIDTGKAYQMVHPDSPDFNLMESVNRPLDEWRDKIRNDFEEPIFEIYPDLKSIKEHLYRCGAIYASMSGSGSSIYGLFRDEPDLPSELNRLMIWKGELIPVT